MSAVVAGWSSCKAVAPILAEHHYLGPINRGIAWHDEHGVIVVSSPTARNVPSSWVELSRWCLIGRIPNAGSQQWSKFVRAFRELRPDVTTIVSYSDPAQGHTGALYRACNWWWAPTWHRLRPPPSGNGSWSTKGPQGVKDRWIFPLQPDEHRSELLVAKDESILRRMPWARYSEPGGVPFKLFGA
jgi:hypothetical protein